MLGSLFTIFMASFLIWRLFFAENISLWHRFFEKYSNVNWSQKKIIRIKTFFRAGLLSLFIGFSVISSPTAVTAFLQPKTSIKTKDKPMDINGRSEDEKTVKPKPKSLSSNEILKERRKRRGKAHNEILDTLFRKGRWDSRINNPFGSGIVQNDNKYFDYHHYGHLEQLLRKKGIHNLPKIAAVQKERIKLDTSLLGRGKNLHVLKKEAYHDAKQVFRDVLGLVSKNPHAVYPKTKKK